MAKAKAVLKAENSAELLSYIINVTPELRDNIDLPVQGQSIEPIGKIIINNQRYRNAFINTINMIGLTVLKRNSWGNPWNFTERGTINFGQQVREIINDLAHVYDYNETFENKTDFLKTEVPNIYQYLHELNFQKYYKTTTSDAQMAMAFTTADGLFNYIDDVITMLYESLTYDTYLVNKYMLCRRMLDGTITPVKIDGATLSDTRDVVAQMKGIYNKMTFRKPNFNPAGIRRATRYEDQHLILSDEFYAKVDTKVLATSFFRNDAEFKSNLAIIDGFDDFDKARLKEVLLSAYEDFTEEEITELKSVLGCIVSSEWFMDYTYSLDTSAEGSTKQTEFYNPQTLENNHFLHAWKIFSTSPFENACVFTTSTPSVESVTLNPTEASITAGQSLQLKADVVSHGFANKAVFYKVTKGADKGVKVSNIGLVTIPKDFEVTPGQTKQVEITATSVFDNTKTSTASITVL